MRAAANRRRQRRKQEAPREEYGGCPYRLRGRARGMRNGGVLGRPIRLEEMDRGNEEAARRPDSAAARSEAVRDLRVRRKQYALAVPAAEPEYRRCGRAT